MGSEVPTWFLRQVVTTVQRLAPDVIVLTGDFVHSRPGMPMGSPVSYKTSVRHTVLLQCWETTITLLIIPEIPAYLE